MVQYTITTRVDGDVLKIFWSYCSEVGFIKVPRNNKRCIWVRGFLLAYIPVQFPECLVCEFTLSYRKALKTARSDYFSSLLEQNKHNPRYLFNTVAKLTKNKASTGVDISQQHSSNDFMNYFTSKIDTIRDQIVTMQPSAILSHQIVYYRSPEEQFHSFSTIGEEELYKLVKSSKPTTCMLDPIPSKLLKEVLPEVIDPLLLLLIRHCH